MKALEIYAGPGALKHLREHRLAPQHVRAIPAAAGGPKGLVLNALDRYLFGDWLAGGTHTVHLLGASIGAWRMAAACLDGPDTAFARMAHDYIHQTYEHAPGKPPTARHVSEVFGTRLAERFGVREAQLLSQRRYRLHVFTSRGRQPAAEPAGALLDCVLARGGARHSGRAGRCLLGWRHHRLRTLPRGKLPDRSDFKQHGDDLAGRVAAWTRAVQESERLRDEFAQWVCGARRVEVQALA